MINISVHDSLGTGQWTWKYQEIQESGDES